MSLLDEREFYKPFNYAWAYEAYKTQNQMHWIPDEVNLADDLKDFRENLNEDNRNLLTKDFKTLPSNFNKYKSGPNVDNVSLTNVTSVSNNYFVFNNNYNF